MIIAGGAVNRQRLRLLPLVGSTIMLAVGACRSEREPPSRKDTGGAPAAGVSAATTSFVDTAHQLPGATPGEDNPVAQWIFFAASGDSIAVSADNAALTTNFGEEKVGRLTAPFFHKRLVRDGLLTVEVITPRPFLQQESPVYAIRFERFASSASAFLRPSGQRAFLTIGLDTSNEMFAVIPLSKAKALTDPSPWQVPTGDYRVALVADSLYVVCRKACSIADTVRLAPGRRATAFH